MSRKTKYAPVMELADMLDFVSVTTLKKLWLLDRSNSSRKIKYASMAELADALDLGSSGRPCRFDSCYSHQESIRTLLLIGKCSDLLFISDIEAVRNFIYSDGFTIPN